MGIADIVHKIIDLGGLNPEYALRVAQRLQEEKPRWANYEAVGIGLKDLITDGLDIETAMNFYFETEEDNGDNYNRGYLAYKRLREGGITPREALIKVKELKKIPEGLSLYMTLTSRGLKSDVALTQLLGMAE